MDTDSRRKMVSLEQLNMLLDFMKEHRDLAKGLIRGRRGKLMTLQLWDSCALILNATTDGAVKDGKGWSKYWCDWKYRVRRHALEVSAAKEGDRPPPDGLTPLSAIEQTIMNIIGENAHEEVVIKSDPLGEMDSDEDVPESNRQDKATPINTGTGLGKRKRQNSSTETSELDNQASSPLGRNTKTSGEVDEPELDEESARFFLLEEKKLRVARAQAQSLETIATQVTRLADSLSRIINMLENSFPNN